jgi:hypothetical protein
MSYTANFKAHATIEAAVAQSTEDVRADFIQNAQKKTIRQVAEFIKACPLVSIESIVDVDGDEGPRGLNCFVETDATALKAVLYSMLRKQMELQQAINTLSQQNQQQAQAIHALKASQASRDSEACPFDDLA